MEPFFDSAVLHALLERLRAGAVSTGADSAMKRGRRRDGGVYFTPGPLVEFVVDRALDALEPLGWRKDGRSPLRILDPAAGDGRFLAAAARALVRRSGGRLTLPRALERCVGFDRDPSLADLAASRLPGAEVRCCEALLGAGDIGRFDLVVGNPPYIRSIRLGKSDDALRQALRDRYQATSHGEWDLYAAFIEQSYAWLADGGVAGLVVPSRWLTARSATRLRAELARLGAVRAIVDFGAEQLFDGATTYSSLLFLSRAGSRKVTVGRLRGDDFAVGEVATDTLGAAPWRVSVGRGREIVESMRAAGPPLSELARVVKGTGTNADSVFVLRPDVDIEAELVRPCVRGRDVCAGGELDREVRCLVPYDADGQLFEPEVMAARFPRAHAYLESRRDILEAREKGRFRGARFYQFGRPQNLRVLLARQPKIIVPDVARRGRAMLDRDGALVLDSAYAVLPREEGDIERLLAVLNSPAVALWLGETGIPLRGGYVRMKTAYLGSLPIAADTGDLASAYGVRAGDWSRK